MLPEAVVVSMARKPELADLPSFLQTDCPAGEPLAVSLRRFFLGADGKSDPFAFESAPGLYHVRSFVKIQDGCDNACRYCRVRLARGRSVSLPFEEALRRITAAEAAGAAEIVLSGVNLSQYRDGGADLCDLIEAAARRLTSARIRLSSLEPDFVGEKLARAVSHPKVCPHFHLALQSGSSAVLAQIRFWLPMSSPALTGKVMTNSWKPSGLLPKTLFTLFTFFRFHRGREPKRRYRSIRWRSGSATKGRPFYAPGRGSRRRRTGKSGRQSRRM